MKTGCTAVQPYITNWADAPGIPEGHLTMKNMQSRPDNMTFCSTEKIPRRHGARELVMENFASEDVKLENHVSLMHSKPLAN